MDNYEIIYASVDVEGDMANSNEFLNIYIPEPSFGGGGEPEEIERAYDKWDEDIAIAEKVLTPYSDKKVGDSYGIKLNKISNASLIPSY